MCRKRLYGDCRGLLADRPFREFKPDIREEMECPANERVILLTHRSIYEFLEGKNIQQTISSHLPEFRKEQALSYIILQYIRKNNQDLLVRSYCAYLVERTLSLYTETVTDDSAYSYLRLLELELRKTKLPVLPQISRASHESYGVAAYGGFFTKQHWLCELLYVMPCLGNLSFIEEGCRMIQIGHSTVSNSQQYQFAFWLA